jgi:hypothetical protein
MAAMSFDEVWDAVRSLTPEEQQRLRALLDTLQAYQGTPLGKPDELALLLLKEGVISEIPPPPTEEDIIRHKNWKPIEIQGEPLSETIIRERR